MRAHGNLKHEKKINAAEKLREPDVVKRVIHQKNT
jgi:hypothetical protein